MVKVIQLIKFASLRPTIKMLVWLTILIKLIAIFYPGDGKS